MPDGLHHLSVMINKEMVNKNACALSYDLLFLYIFFKQE